MDLQSISEIAKAGMTLERNRVELASSRLAIANVGFSSEIEANLAAQTINDKQSFINLLFDNGQTVSQSVNIKIQHDQQHPNADSDGNVFFLDVDPIHEMATLVSALRSYEANIRAYNTNSEMNQAALSIGGSQ